MLMSIHMCSQPREQVGKPRRDKLTPAYDSSGLLPWPYARILESLLPVFHAKPARRCIP